MKMDDDQCPGYKEQFVSIDKCLELVDKLKTISEDSDNSKNVDNEDKSFSKTQSEYEKLFETFRKLIDPFQEQPELLDPYLADLIQRLINELSDENISSSRYHTTFKFLYQLIKVMGFKNVAKKFPHETDKLPLLIELLDKESPEDRTNWQTRFVLLVWLSIVILTPFDLSKFDSDSTQLSIAQRIHLILMKSLDLHDSCQHVAAYCLSKFFSRPDILKSSDKAANNNSNSSSNQESQAALNVVDLFVGDALNELANVKTGFTGSMDDIKLIGRLRALCYMYKFLPRNEMKSRSSKILEVINQRIELDKINRELVTHLIIKLAQRAGLALLPKPIASWRYKRGSRILGSLADEITSQVKGGGGVGGVGGEREEQEGKGKEERSPPLPPPPSQNQAAPLAGGAPVNQQHEQQPSESEQEVEESNYVDNCQDEQKHEHEDDDDVSSSEHLESLLSILFVAAQNSQTKIRWSAAKGIARLASRLNRDRASDVIDMVLESFFNDQTSSDFAWHGGCLTLAEMSRNGLILSEKLPQVIGVISRAILYDKIKGSSAVGAHVRESACYVCWAMARSYEDHLLASYIGEISIKLLCTMLYDRELQCRRAASATFQELVGRQGTFNEEGINILTQVDYQNVGQRQFAYLHLAQQVASYGPNYSEPFAQHLIEKKICHWDVKLRRLACDSLSALMLHLNQDYIRAKIIPRLIELGSGGISGSSSGNQSSVAATATAPAAATDNNSKHGALLALAKIIGGLAPLQFEYPEGLRDFVGQIVKVCDKQLKNKQQQGFFMEAIGCMITGAELAKFHYPEDKCDTLKEWNQLALTALNSDDQNLREIGSKALLTLYRTYYKENKTSQDFILKTLNETLESPNESSRCGALLALSKLSESLSDGNSNDLDVDVDVDANTEKKRMYVPKTDADTPDIILQSLSRYISKDTHEKGRNFVFAEAKATACEAFVNFIRNLNAKRVIVSSELIKSGYDALLEKTEDYTFDRRGDIGVVVRRAAIRSLQELTLHLLSIGCLNRLLLTRERITCLFARILQQAVSYNNSAREQAAQAFYKLIVSNLLPEKSLPYEGFKEEIMSLFERHQVNSNSNLNLNLNNDHDDGGGIDFNWRDDSTPIFVSLLARPEFSRDLWIGLIPAVGQESDLCAKQFRDSLADYMLSLQQQEDEEDEEEEQKQQTDSNSNNGNNSNNNKLRLRLNTLNTFLTTVESFQSARLCTAALIVADFLLSQGLMEGVDMEFQRRLLAFCWKSRGSGADPKRLSAVVRLLNSMLQFDTDKYIIQ